METVLVALGTALVSNFAQWVFFQRKHKAEASGAEINNDRSEIENLKLITQEWRDAAQAWKDMADEYQSKHIANSRKVDELIEEVHGFKRKLERANKRIAHLERELERERKTQKTPADGHE